MRAYNVDEVGKTRKDSLLIINLVGNVTEQEVKKNYRKISRIYHPDKHRPVLTGMSPNQAEEYFKLVNNAYEFYAQMRNGHTMKHQKGKTRAQ